MASPKTYPPQAQPLVAAGLESILLVASDPEYTTREESYYSLSTRLSPAVIALPSTAEDILLIVSTLAKHNQPFAIRSGGCANYVGANNIAGGVVLDLSRINKVVYDPDTEEVRIGAGARWREVYAALKPYGRVVAGGREGTVGVGGFLLGGGISFFTGLKGFASDNVVSYTVITGGGQILTATAKEHEPLFWALKGGGNNFGVVESFVMSTIPCDKIWGGLSVFPRTEIPTAIEALHDFTEDAEKHPESHLIVVSGYTPQTKDSVVTAIYVQTRGEERAEAYKRWLEMPEVMSTVKMTTVAEYVEEYSYPGGLRNVWFTTTFKNDTRILTEASRLHDGVIKDMQGFIPDSDFSTQCVYQPLPKMYAQRTADAGGNYMGMERQRDDGILFVVVVMVQMEEQEQFAHGKLKALIEAIEDFARGVDGWMEWRYLNYADGSQDVLGSYGKENVCRMKDVMAKYDPDGVFQKLVPGGFKISEVACCGKDHT